MDVETLRSRIFGQLITSADPNYDEERIVWNGMIDKRPAIIARCRNAGDVAATVNFARSNKLPLAVRSGGHNVAGYAVCDGGLMLDMSLMNGVRISPDRKTAVVEGGATWRDVDAASTPFGLATPGGLISATGVAGLTLSGGIGWLRGTHGLCCDNLIAADVVTADGNLRRASATENPDLLWALKGGGGNFGVVVGFEFSLHPIENQLMFCAPAYAEEDAPGMLSAWRDYMDKASERVSGLAEFSTLPDDPSLPEHARGRRVVALATVYDGPADEGEAATMPLRQLATPLVDFSDRMPYATIQTLYDSLFPKGRDRCYWKSTYLARLDDQTIGEITKRLTTRPSEMTYASVWRFAGAVQGVPADATAFGDRSMPFMLSIDAIWPNPSDDAANIGWVRNFWAAMQPYSNGRLYLNFPGHGEGPDLVRDALGQATYRRLQQVKSRYDPTNLFCINQNILPA